VRDDEPSRRGQALILAFVVAVYAVSLGPWIFSALEGGPDGTGPALGVIDLRSIDVNRAGAAELETLPGIGPVLAARIVAERERRGPFRSVDDLRRVSGIGPVTSRKLAPYLLFGPGSGAAGR
jgi:competence ComEA-like helix-hairpin-helix protein